MTGKLTPRSKTDPYGEGFVVPLLGPGARALRHWLRRSKITEGYLFRGIRTNGVLTTQIASKTIARMIKDRVAKAGLNTAEYGAHSLRMGFITESARQRVSIVDTMALSGHRTLEIAAGYYRESEVLRNPASRLIR